MIRLEHAFAGAAALSFALGAAVRPVLRRLGFLDRPNDRSSHVRPTVRGGGVGFVLVVLGAMILIGVASRPIARAVLATAVATGLLAAVSFVDDARGLSVRTRLATQALAALVPTGILLVSSSLPTWLRYALAPVAFVGTVGFTNAFNFMDGINGIATTHAVITSLATTVLAHGAGLGSIATVAAVTAGATAGFLPWNFPNARMFMGDVGSAVLGFVLASFVVGVASHARLDFVLPLALAHAGFVLDTGITLIRRAARGERLSEAHREHFYQRLVRSGASHGAVTCVYATTTAIGAAVGIATAQSSRFASIAGVLVVVALWLGVFAYAETRFRRSIGTRP